MTLGEKSKSHLGSVTSGEKSKFHWGRMTLAPMLERFVKSILKSERTSVKLSPTETLFLQ